MSAFYARRMRQCTLVHTAKPDTCLLRHYRRQIVRGPLSLVCSMQHTLKPTIPINDDQVFVAADVLTINEYLGQRL